MPSLKFFIRAVLAAAALPFGWLIHTITGTTPDWAKQSMIFLLGASGGVTNDLMSRFVSFRYPATAIVSGTGVVAALTPQERMQGGAALVERGYFVLPRRVPSAMCDRLLEFALTRPALVDTHDGNGGRRVSAVYDPARPLGPHYQFERKDLINHPDVQALMADPVLIELAQAYLEAEPVADFIKMWWYSASSGPQPAQMYHCDMSRIKWVKFFIYLTDVGPGNGPHCFVGGTHRTGMVPTRFFARGYAHLSDEEVTRHYGTRDVAELTGPRGTIIVADTRGLHKGEQVRVGHRLMLQIQFSNSLFGHAYPRTPFEGLRAPGLIEMAARHPRIYSAFLPPSQR